MSQVNYNHQCTECPKFFTQKSSLTRHVGESHGRLPRSICPLCKSTFKAPRTLEVHLTENICRPDAKDARAAAARHIQAEAGTAGRLISAKACWDLLRENALTQTLEMGLPDGTNITVSLEFSSEFAAK